MIEERQSVWWMEMETRASNGGWSTNYSNFLRNSSKNLKKSGSRTNISWKVNFLVKMQKLFKNKRKNKFWFQILSGQKRVHVTEQNSMPIGCQKETKSSNHSQKTTNFKSDAHFSRVIATLVVKAFVTDFVDRVDAFLAFTLPLGRGGHRISARRLVGHFPSLIGTSEGMQLMTNN